MMTRYIFCPVKLIDCPPQFEFYKELSPLVPLIIKEKDQKLDSFTYGGFRSSHILRLETWQTKITDPIYIEIITENNHYVFVCKG